MRDRVCGGVQVPDAPLNFPSLALSVLDAEITKLQSSLSAAAAVQPCFQDLRELSIRPSHVCHACAVAEPTAAAPSSLTSTDTCAQPESCATQLSEGVGNATPATQLNESVRGCSWPWTDGHPAQVPLHGDSGKQGCSHYQVQENLPANFPNPVSPDAPTCTWERDREAPPTHQAMGRDLVDGQNIERYSAENMASDTEIFVADHVGGIFDIMEWYIQSRPSAPPPCLPRCSPFSVAPSEGLPIQSSTQHRFAKSCPGGGSEQGRHTFLQLGWKGQMTAWGPSANVSNKQDRRTVHAEAMHAMSDLKHTPKPRRGRCGQGGSKAGAQAVQQGAVQKQGGKKRGGRLVRELAATDAADRGGMVELGFNAHLKQFEKSQREKGVFKNRQKPRPSVYTVSGVPHHE